MTKISAIIRGYVCPTAAVRQVSTGLRPRLYLRRILNGPSLTHPLSRSDSCDQPPTSTDHLLKITLHFQIDVGEGVPLIYFGRISKKAIFGRPNFDEN